jgi:hypothetical protein
MAMHACMRMTCMRTTYMPMQPCMRTTYMPMHACMRTTYMPMRACMHAHHIHAHACMHAHHVHGHAHHGHGHAHASTYTCASIRAYTACVPCMRTPRTCMHPYMPTCIACLHPDVHADACLRACMHAPGHACKCNPYIHTRMPMHAYNDAHHATCRCIRSNARPCIPMRSIHANACVRACITYIHARHACSLIDRLPALVHREMLSSPN